MAGHARETTTMKALLEQAWQRSAAGRSQPARAEEAEATRAQSRSWLGSAPVLGLAQRSDRWNDGRGQKENEASLAATVLLPSQVSARRAYADRLLDDAGSQLAKARLDLAGELRSRFWDLASAQAVLAERESHVKHMGELADEVARRVAAGELARSDSLLAQQELSTARILAAQAGSATRTAMARLQQLTGSAHLPAPVAETLADLAAAQDPRLAAAAAAERKAAAALDLVRANSLPAPTISLSWRHEREAALAAPERSVGLAIQLPLGSAGRNRIAAAQALAQKEASAAEHALLVQNAQVARELAAGTLEDARNAVQAAEQRAAAMREYSQLIDKAFHLGERGLTDLVRAHILAHEAEIGLRQQQAAVGRAHAEYNQAAGVLP
jgi:outer membrane protein TolC